MRCRDALALLNAAVDNSLGVVRRELLRAHLLRCPECRAEAAATRSLSEQLSSLPAPTGFEDVRQAATALAHGTCPPTVRLTNRLVRARFVVALGATALLLVMALGFLARVSPAEASYNDVVAAAGAVRSYHLDQWVLLADGTRLSGETWYAYGQWREETRLDGSLHELRVFDGRELHFYDAEAHRVWLNVSDRPLPREFQGFTVGDVLRRTGQRMEDVTVEQIEDEAGRSLMRFAVVTQDHQGKVLILADSETNLPVAIEFYDPEDGGWALRAALESITYDIYVDPQRFVLVPPKGAEIVDRDRWDELFWTRYEEGIDRVSAGRYECILRDFQVAVGSDVFAIWTWPGYHDGGMVWGTSAPVPNTIYPGAVELEDSLGTTYIWSTTCFRAGIWGDGYGWFIPETPPQAQPEWYRLALRYAFPKGAPGEGFEDVTISFLVRKPMLLPSHAPEYPPSSARRGQEVIGPDEAEFVLPREGTRARILEAYADDPVNWRFQIRPER